jgi:hypothetical protein
MHLGYAGMGRYEGRSAGRSAGKLAGKKAHRKAILAAQWPGYEYPMMPAQALDLTPSCQASAEHFEQCAEFPLLRNRGLSALAVTVLPIPLARRAAATACAAVQSTAALFRRR